MLAATTASITHDDPYQAGRDLAAELNDALGASPDVVLLFAASTYDPHSLLAGLHRRLARGVQLVGCTSFAEINHEGAVSGTVTALGVRTRDLAAHALHATRASGDSFAIGCALGEQARERDASLLLLFVDGVRLHSGDVLRGVQSVLGPDFPIVGGLAADDARFERIREFCGRDVLEGAVVGLALAGPLRHATVARGGWEPIGATRRCTRVERDRLVLELDGQPALNIYREYLGAQGRDLKTAGIEFPLGIVGMPDRPWCGDDHIHVVRAVYGVDEARGGLRCNREIPEGAEIRMLRATKEDLIRGAAEAAADLGRALPGGRIALVFDCFARKMVLGARYKEEVAAAYSRLSPATTRVGFYTYGELAPIAGQTEHHDATFTAVVIDG
ncbi:FIST N-terminal domain-containing protein [Nannocystis sp. SCPEA4]|uniref:FIST signal transduction protein n=1 Tax=Nannocystis sp. SCPEA4 TaxID=2996787 RepID=UPI00226F228B|nr:FIST N-terminal domain-containing protein [Nannocystis sp. SCPEA4]MCY1058693.1 FIST C-terminal domain-containing protein [Nannocystis sp. SCPEA4]